MSLPPSVRAITTAGSRKKGLRPYKEGRREEEMKGEERRKTEGEKRDRGEEGGRQRNNLSHS